MATKAAIAHRIACCKIDVHPRSSLLHIHRKRSLACLNEQMSAYAPCALLQCTPIEPMCCCAVHSADANSQGRAVIVCAGAVPNTLPLQGVVTLATDGGIVVDAALLTNKMDIYAAGGEHCILQPLEVAV